jgi:hypothetical protein
MRLERTKPTSLRKIQADSEFPLASSSQPAGEYFNGEMLNEVPLSSTSTSLTISPSAATYGGAVVLTASVAASGVGVPTGTVTFAETLNGSTNSVGSATLNNGGVASLSVIPPSVEL